MVYYSGEEVLSGLNQRNCTKAISEGRGDKKSNLWFPKFDSLGKETGMKISISNL